MFSAGGLHRIAFSLAADARTAIDGADRPEVRAGLEFDGVRQPDVGLRLKGSGSYERIDGKPSFNVDLNRWVKGARLDGLKAFRLHSAKTADPTRTHEWLAYALARDAGLLAPRVGFAEVSVDGQPYGLYVLVEKHDDVMIAVRNPAQADRGVILEPAGIFIDFGIGALAGDADVKLQQACDEGPEPPDPAVIARLKVLDDVLAREPSEANLGDLWGLVDRDRFLAYHAWEVVVRHVEGYRDGPNWRMFVDGDTLMVEWVASGADITWNYLGGDGAVTVGPQVFEPDLPDSSLGQGRAFHVCLKVPTCRKDYARRVLQMADRVQELGLFDRFEELSAMLAPCIASDPKPLFDAKAVRDTIVRTRSALTGWQQKCREQVGAEYPDLVP